MPTFRPGNGFFRFVKTKSKVQSRRMSRRFSQAVDGIYKNLTESNLIGDKESTIIVANNLWGSRRTTNWSERILTI